MTSPLSSYREKNEALKVYNDERHYLPAERRAPLKEIGSCYRQQLEDILLEAARDGEIRAEIECHFSAQAIIGLCNAFGELIVRDPDLDLFDLIHKCTDLLQNGLAPSA